MRSARILRWVAPRPALVLPAVVRCSYLRRFVRQQAPEGQGTVTDGSQIEPRILAALSRDEALASAGRGADLYAGIAELAREGCGFDGAFPREGGHGDYVRRTQR